MDENSRRQLAASLFQAVFVQSFHEDVTIVVGVVAVVVMIVFGWDLVVVLIIAAEGNTVEEVMVGESLRLLSVMIVAVVDVISLVTASTRFQFVVVVVVVVVVFVIKCRVGIVDVNGRHTVGSNLVQ